MGGADSLIRMTRRRFHAPPDSFNAAEQIVTLGPDEARHLRDVLRLKPGDEVTLIGHPAKSGVKIMVLDKMILANGKEVPAKAVVN